MDRVWESGASLTPPPTPALSVGYPTAGAVSPAVPATEPGPWWFHMVTEELRALIVGAGLTPDATDLTQLRDAVLKFTPAGSGAVPTTVQEKLRKTVHASDFGAVGDVEAIRKAMVYVALLGGGIVHIDAGLWIKPATSTALPQLSNVTLKGAGMGATVLQHADSSGTNRFIGSVSIGGSCSNFTIEDLTLAGSWSPSLNSNGLQIAELWYVTNLTLNRVEVRDSRSMGITGRFCNGVSITNCIVTRTNADGIAFWDCADVRVNGNRLVDCDDDAISLHTNDTTAGPLRNRVEVIGNVISTSQGIKVLGAKSVIIAYNALSRVYAYGVYVNVDTTFNQGNTPNHSVQIFGNVINDVFKRVQGGNAEQYYMRIGGGQRQAGPLAAAPGRNITGTGAISDLFGTLQGYFQAQNTDDSSVASPGGYFWHVSDNTLARTLPAVSAISDWGFGNLWCGNQGSGTYTGAVTEADLNTDGIRIEGSIKRALVESNIIATTGDKAIHFNVGGAPANLLFEDFTIRSNKIADFKSYGIFWPGGTISVQDIRVIGNDFDGDPRLVSANRGSNGTWLAGTLPSAVYAAVVSGFNIARNEIKNVAVPITAGGSSLNNLSDNVLRCDPSAIGFSTSNKGIGSAPRSGSHYRYFIEDSDPTSSTFGQLLNATLLDSNTMPTTGKYMPGHTVRCVNPSVAGSIGSQYVLTGWIRTTLGTAHVIDTDWREMRCLTGT